MVSSVKGAAANLSFLLQTQCSPQIRAQIANHYHFRIPREILCSKLFKIWDFDDILGELWAKNRKQPKFKNTKSIKNTHYDSQNKANYGREEGEASEYFLHLQLVYVGFNKNTYNSLASVFSLNIYTTVTALNLFIWLYS